MFGKPGIRKEDAMPPRWKYAEDCHPERAVIKDTLTFNGRAQERRAANRGFNAVPMLVREFEDVLILEDGPTGHYRLVKITEQPERISA